MSNDSQLIKFSCIKDYKEKEILYNRPINSDSLFWMIVLRNDQPLYMQIIDDRNIMKTQLLRYIMNQKKGL